MNAPYIEESTRIEAALFSISPNIEREQWWKVAAAIKSEFGEAGFDLFDCWSQGGQKYDAKAVRDTWKSTKAAGGIGIATLFSIAKDNGFDPRQHHAAHIDPAESARRRAERDRLAAAECIKIEAEQRTAAKRAAEIWVKAETAPEGHAYLVRKGVKAHSLRLYRGKQSIRGMACDGCLIVPARGVNGEITTLEFIGGDCEKRFLPNGRKSGSYHLIGEPRDILCLAEGYATAASVHEATGYAVAVAFDAGNLRTVAEALKAQFPNARLVLCADDDVTTPGNPGLTKAREAATAVGGLLATPDFGSERPDDASDFNDLHNAQGLEAIKRCIEVATLLDGENEPDAPDATTFPGLEDRPCWRVYCDWVKVGVDRFKPGVYYHSVKPGKGSGEAPPELIDRWECTPLRVQAVTRNREDGDYGRLLEFIAPSGKWKKWAMPMSMLAGDGNAAREVLLSEGVTYDLNNRGGILRYIAGQHPERTMRAAATTGWCDGAFVLPDAVIGAEDIWFQAAGRTAPYGVTGTFDGWCKEVAALATGNPLLMLAICTALAGPLLEPLNVDGGGVNLHGDSSTGKTTALRAAVSVWGGQAFRRTWRATANGLEGAGAMHTDTLLALDELGEVDPKDLYESAYALVNGYGKTRSNKHGEARQVMRWRVFLLSTGELTVAGRMAAGGIEAKAGQGLRILDIPVSGIYGLFDTLHGHPSGGALSDVIRDATAKHYGHAGPAFVAALVEGRQRNDLSLSEALVGILTRFGAADGQHGRAARVLALCALAGELAVDHGIVPWGSGEPTCAAIHAFNLWRRQRGGDGQGAEHVAILRAVADFIDRHGDSRFSNINDRSTMPIRDRAGYWRDDGFGRLFLFTSAGLREAVKGFDMTRALSALHKAGALADMDHAKRSKTTRTPGGRATRLYHIDPEKLSGGE